MMFWSIGLWLALMRPRWPRTSSGSASGSRVAAEPSSGCLNSRLFFGQNTGQLRRRKESPESGLRWKNQRQSLLNSGSCPPKVQNLICFALVSKLIFVFFICNFDSSFGHFFLPIFYFYGSIFFSFFSPFFCFWFFQSNAEKNCV